MYEETLPVCLGAVTFRVWKSNTDYFKGVPSYPKRRVFYNSKMECIGMHPVLI